MIAFFLRVGRCPKGMGGVHRVKDEANFEAKASGVRSTPVGGGRVVIVDGERRPAATEGPAADIRRKTPE